MILPRPLFLAALLAALVISPTSASAQGETKSDAEKQKSALSSPGSKTEMLPPPPPPVTASAGASFAAVAFLDLLFAGVVTGVFVALTNSGKWSLSSSLNETSPSPVTPLPKPAPAPVAAGGAVFPPPPNPYAKTTTNLAQPAVQPPESSSSRLIAFVGMLATVAMFLGIGNWVLWHCFRAGRVPDGLDRLLWFLGSGASLFLPYALNQVSGALTEFSKLGRRA